MIEFKDEAVQCEYDDLLMQEEDLSDDLERVQRRIREIEATAERE
jgi:hypothetical protein